MRTRWAEAVEGHADVMCRHPEFARDHLLRAPRAGTVQQRPERPEQSPPSPFLAIGFNRCQRALQQRRHLDASTPVGGPD